MQTRTEIGARIERLDMRLAALKSASMFNKAEAAELALHDAVATLRCMAERIEALEAACIR